MSELLVGIVGMVLLYALGRVLYPDTPKHKPIQQELIKIGDDKNVK
mgnify:CR=1 FL=1|tara:strand:- start:654 stop:791 length:138 start_codon:yes stop_codon:yes gene_type:complete